MHVRKFGVIEGDVGLATEARPDEPAIRVAIATNDHRFLDAHFGSAASFAIFEVAASHWRFVEMVAFDDPTSGGGHHSDDVDRIGPKVEALRGTALLFVLAIGGPAAAQVVRAGIHPIKIKDAEPLGAVVLRVQRMLLDKPPPWLRKVLRQDRAKRDFIDDGDAEERVG